MGGISSSMGVVAVMNTASLALTTTDSAAAQPLFRLFTPAQLRARRNRPNLVYLRIMKHEIGSAWYKYLHTLINVSFRKGLSPAHYLQ